MSHLQVCRAQEAQCRRRAETDEPHRDLWLSMAERWSYLALKESISLGDDARRARRCHRRDPFS
jgi:hypothetical protein